MTESGTVEPDQVRTAVGAALARYKVPRDVVAAAEIPRTPTGKILRREVATLIAAGES